MSDKIMAGLPEDFVRRMRNWARARAGLLSAMGISFTSAYEGFRYDRSPELGIPVLAGDAEQTDALLKRLPPRYRQAVELWWDHEGAPLRYLARKTGKHGVDHHTFVVWVQKGHEALMAEVRAHITPKPGQAAEQARLIALGA